MIVKNESRIIERLLASVLPLIDTYCICDTGSTDNTQEIITQFFRTHGKSGKIIEEPFRDFAHNRSVALKACDGMAEFALLLDADMILTHGADFTSMYECAHWLRNRLQTALAANDANQWVDTLTMMQGSATFYYSNARIVRTGAGMHYCGVTHEFLNFPGGSSDGGVGETTSSGRQRQRVTNLPRTKVFIQDIGDGGCKADKFERDIRLLTAALETEPTNDRYWFYLANSYRDVGDDKNAKRCYEKRIALGGWSQEVWQSHFHLGHLAMRAGKAGEGVRQWLLAAEVVPDRIENIYEIVKHFRTNNKHRLAAYFYKMAKQMILGRNVEDMNHLFMQRSVYDFLLDYEFTIFQYYVPDLFPSTLNMGKLVTRLINQMMSTPGHRESYEQVKNVETLFSNYKFYVQTLPTQPLPPWYKAMEDVLRSDDKTGRGNHGVELPPTKLMSPEAFAEFHASTPSLCYRQGEWLLLRRDVNYRLELEQAMSSNVMTYRESSRFPLTSLNRLFSWQQASSSSSSLLTCQDQTILTTFPDRLPEITEKERGMLYFGIEDMRIFAFDNDPVQGRVFYSGNRLRHCPQHGGRRVIEVQFGEICRGAASSDEDSRRRRHIGKTVTFRSNESCEKNWVPIVASSRHTPRWAFDPEMMSWMFVYDWYPLAIVRGSCDPDKAASTSINELLEQDEKDGGETDVVLHETPELFRHFRGSTPGIYVQDKHEFWFLVHVVVHESFGRSYYHVLVALHADTLRPTRYSPMFRFPSISTDTSSLRHVQYALGFVQDPQRPDHFIITFSSKDAVSELIYVSQKDLDSLLELTVP